jgi:hypothetical protein
MWHSGSDVSIILDAYESNKTKNADLLNRKYRLGKTSVNLKYSLVLTEMFRLRPASQFVERYHSIFSCALNMEDLILNNICKFSK